MKRKNQDKNFERRKNCQSQEEEVIQRDQKKINTKGKVLDEKRRLQPFQENMAIEGRIIYNSKERTEMKEN